ncbi:MAG: DAK2 domain-containing protein [Actinobacteria bacterium]|nr:DAK2 domain-containing protein [Actinomycetota bacterium]
MSDLTTVRQLARGALESLERNRQRIDDLNVYPVPDGDTGTNLTLTARSVVDQLEQTTTEDRPGLVKEVTRAALMGARGNSGVILSQIIRGAARVLGSESTVDARVVAQAFQAARDAAYRAVREPVEGTMLSVIRELAEESESADDDSIPELLARLVRRGEEAVARTPEQLDVLREAGVVDAGGTGLLEIVRGIAATVSGEALPDAPFEREEINTDAIHQEPSKYRYCTTFMIEGDDLDSDAIEAEMGQLGDSLLVVGDPEALKVHVHTDEPGRALDVGTRLGTIDRVEIANMHVQTHQREERLLQAVPDAAPAASGVVAVVAGDGNRRLFESLGASRIVEGGQTMNPSTAELAAAIEATPADEVIVLPNNSNVILSADQAAGVASKHVEVVPTDSIPAGLAAMVAFEPDRSAEENATDMRELLESVKTGEVTKASRDVQMNGLEVRKGAWLGLADGEAIAGGPDFEEVAAAVAERLLAEPRGLLTLLKGADEPDLQGLVKRIEELHPGLELEVQEGGQPHYPLLLSAE